MKVERNEYSNGNTTYLLRNKLDFSCNKQMVILSVLDVVDVDVDVDVNDPGVVHLYMFTIRIDRAGVFIRSTRCALVVIARGKYF